MGASSSLPARGYDAAILMTGANGISRMLVCVTDTRPNASFVLGYAPAQCALLPPSDSATFLFTSTPGGVVLLFLICGLLALLTAIAGMLCYYRLQDIGLLPGGPFSRRAGGAAPLE